jgi:hypothetical protein
MTALPLSGLIHPCRDGTFQRLEEFEPGGLVAEFLHVRETVFDWTEEVGDIYDIVAWDARRPGIWWTAYGVAVVLGEWELGDAAWDDRPARMTSTPDAWVCSHGSSFCVVDWSADLQAIIGRASKIKCATPALHTKLRETLIAQAMPRGLVITTQQQPRRAGAATDRWVA